MKALQKAAEIKKLQLEIDKRLCFFTILADIKGSNTGKKKTKLITPNK
jgi:hypothetical protein